MGNQYQALFPGFWADTQDWADDERTLALYLLSCEHRRTEGLFRLPTVYGAHDMGWEPHRYENAAKALERRGWLQRDRDWVLLVNGLRWNAPKGENQTKGAANAVANVPAKSPVYAAFYAKANEHAPHLVTHLDRVIGSPSEAPPKPLRTPETTPFEASTPLHSHSSSSSYSPPRARDERKNTETTDAAAPAVTDAAAVKRVTDPIREALRAAGFDSWTIEQSESAIQLALNELQIPDDVDWHRIGQDLRRLREDGSCRTHQPAGAIRFVAKQLSGMPRLNQAPRGPRPVSPIADAEAQIERIRRIEAEQAA